MNSITLVNPKPKNHLFTDASNSGWGAHMDNLKTQGLWNASKKDLHINCLEVKAIFYSLRNWKSRLFHSSVLIATDNTTVVAYIQKQRGITSSSMMTETLQLFALADFINCQMEARHFPGKMNILADRLSCRVKIVTTEWWSLHPVFNWIMSLWDTSHLDLFATCLNNPLPVYVSLCDQAEFFSMVSQAVATTQVKADSSPFCDEIFFVNPSQIFFTTIYHLLLGNCLAENAGRRFLEIMVQ